MLLAVCDIVIMEYLGSHLCPALTDATRDDDDDDDTASEDESDEGSEGEEDGDDGSESDEGSKHAANAPKKLRVDGDVLKLARRNADPDMESSDDEEEDEDEDDEDEEDSSEEKVVDYSREKDLANRVFEKVMASSKAQELDEAQPNNNVEIEVKQIAKQKFPAKDTKALEKESKAGEIRGSAKKVKEPEVTEPAKAPAKEPARTSKKCEPVAGTSQADSLNRTVFVRNLPLEAKVQDLRRRFADFGEVKSFRLVLHPITK